MLSTRCLRKMALQTGYRTQTVTRSLGRRVTSFPCAFVSAFPDLKITVEDTVVEGRQDRRSLPRDRHALRRWNRSYALQHSGRFTSYES